MENFKELLSRYTTEVESVIDHYLPAEEGHQKTVLEAMNYSMRAGGKRLRPLFMREVYKMFGGQSKVIEPFMAAIEMIHTFSLVHDDMPCMDNDRFRRGLPTTWVEYGEDMAVLAGDALYGYAFETAAKALTMCGSHADASDSVPEGEAKESSAWDSVPEGEAKKSGALDSVPKVEPKESGAVGQAAKADVEKVAGCIGLLASKSGIYGMIGGQTADVELTGGALSAEQLEFIYRLKTGALLEAPMMIGAILAGATEEQVKIVEYMAACVGKAFQIQDDILDLTSSQEVLGKPVLSDEKNQKTTYVTLYGMEQAKAEVEKLSNEAVEALESLPGDHGFLHQLILMLVTREK